jgi:hypothetical protein
MTNPTRTPKIRPNQDKTGLSSVPCRAKQTQFPQARYGDKAIYIKCLADNWRTGPPRKQTQSNPIPGPSTHPRLYAASHLPHRAKQTQFPQPEIEGKSLPNRGLRRIPPQTTREKQTQSNLIAAGVLSAVERISCPPRPAVPGSPPGPCPEQSGARIDRMSVETHTKGSFCTGSGVILDKPTWMWSLGYPGASSGRPREGGSRDWNRL